MVEQAVTSEVLFEGQKVRTFSSNAAVAANVAVNWYIDFDGTPTGERIVSSPIVRGTAGNKRAIFISIVPTDDICGFGGHSWLMELNGNNGNVTTNPVFDLNYDGQVNTLDNGGGTTVYSGWSQTGIQPNPTIISSDRKEFKYFSGSSGKLQTITEALPEQHGRQSWRQIR